MLSDPFELSTWAQHAILGGDKAVYRHNRLVDDLEAYKEAVKNADLTTARCALKDAYRDLRKLAKRIGEDVSWVDDYKECLISSFVYDLMTTDDFVAVGLE